MSEPLHALLEEGIARGFFPGAAAAVGSEAGIETELYLGDARLEPAGERAAVGAETLWDLASLTKPLAGASLVLALAEDRLLSLDDEVSRFGDAFKKTRFAGVTLRRLLAHGAGLADWFPCYVRGEGRAAYRRTLAEVDPASPPGTAVIYSCLGYLVLADVVERVAAEPVDRFFARRVAERLGLARDLLFSPAGADRVRAVGGERSDETERRMAADRGLRYAGFREGVVNGEANDGNAYRRGDGASLNAGLFGTLRAVFEAGRAWLLRDARLLREATFEEGVRPDDSSPAIPADARRALGWDLARPANAAGEALSPRSFGHTGFTGGSLFVDPEARRVFVLLTNRLHPAARAVDMNAFRREFHARAVERGGGRPRATRSGRSRS